MEVIDQLVSIFCLGKAVFKKLLQVLKSLNSNYIITIMTQNHAICTIGNKHINIYCPNQHIGNMAYKKISLESRKLTCSSFNDVFSLFLMDDNLIMVNKMLIEEYVESIVSYEVSFSKRRGAYDGEQVSRVFYNKRHNAPQQNTADQICIDNHISTKVKKANEAQRSLQDGEALPEVHQQVLARHFPTKVKKAYEAQRSLQDGEALPPKFQEVIDKHQSKLKEPDHDLILAMQTVPSFTFNTKKIKLV